MKLMRKFTLGLVAGILVIHFVAGLVRFKRERALFRDDVTRDARAIGRTLAISAENVWTSAGEASARDLVSHVDVTENDVSIHWVSLDAVPREHLADLVRGKPVVLPFSDADPGLYTYTPIQVSGQLRGAIEIRNHMVDERQYVYGSIRNIAISTGILVAFCLAMIWVLGWKFIGQPMRSLVGRAHQIGQGDLSSRLPIDQDDEIGELSGAMNRMCDGLAEAQERVTREMKGRIAAIEQLKHADRLRTVGALASGLAHELGTPLNVIEGYAQITREDPATSPTTREHAEIMIRQTQRMARIIRQLLDFARRGVMQRTPMDLRRVLEDTVAMVEPLARKAGVSINLPAGDDRALALIAKGELQQVLTNILINGIQAMPKGGALIVELDKQCVVAPGSTSATPRDFLRVAIKDTGVGMSPEVCSHIFEPFFTTKDVGEGTGLGLSVAHGIIHDHGGWIEVTSEEGSGSEFAIHVPVEVEG